MAVQEQTPYIVYECNGITKVFPINFDCHDSDHLIVKLDDIDTPIGMWALSNGSVNFYAAPQIGSKLSIQRNTPLERLTEYNSYDNSMRPEVLNKDLDRTWYAIQEINAEVGEKVDKKLRINTTGNVIGGGELYNDLTITLKDQAVTPNKVFGSSTKIPSITLNQDGTVKEVGEQPATTGSASITIQNNSFQRAALVGDVTAALDSNTTTISNGAVSNTKLSPMSINTLKGSISLDVVQDLSVAQVQKLLNVQDGATKNQTDSYLISRTNHTGTQPIDTVKELPEVLDSKQDNLIAGDHITIKENVITALVDVNKAYVDQELAVKLGKTENAVSATKLLTARKINGVAFDATKDITIVDNTKLGVTENAVSASKLETARRINGVLFDGTKDITLSGGEGSGGVSKDYVDQELAVKLGKTENAVSATKLQTARTISFSGAATGSASYDGSSNSSCILTLANSGVVEKSYGSNLKIPTITVNAKGLITGVSEQQIPIVDDLTTGGSAKLLSAEQGKLLQANKLDKTALNNTLTSTSSTQALTAAQGKVLSDRTQSATDKKEGISRFATATEVANKSNVMAAVTPANVDAMIEQFPNATETVAGKAKIATTAIAQAGVNDADFLTPKKLRDALNATGDAPIFACRAWGYIDGTLGVLVKGGNIESISRESLGFYTIHFSKPMPNTDYAIFGMCMPTPYADDNAVYIIREPRLKSRTTTSVSVVAIFTTAQGGVGLYYPPFFSIGVFC